MNGNTQPLRATRLALLWPPTAAIAIYLLCRPLLDEPQAQLIAVVALLVVWWTNEALPLGVVSLLPLLLFPAFAVAPMSAVAVHFANPMIFLFLGGFMLAIAVEKSSLHQQIAFRLMQLFPATVKGTLFALTLTSALLSGLLSNTTVALLLMPLALFLSDDATIRPRLALGIAYGASIGGITTPIGTPPNLILLGFLQQHELAAIPFARWIALVLPLSLTMLFVVTGLLGFGLGNRRLSAPAAPRVLDGAQRRLLFVLAALLLILLLNAPIEPYYAGLGLDERAILLAFGLSMFVPSFGILVWQDSRRIPFEIVFLFGAGFSIAGAFTSTGLSAAIGSELLQVTQLSPWLLVLLIAALVTFTTEITSNTALISMMLPVVYAMCTRAGLDTSLLLMVATICASYAFMLPIATPPNAIAVGSGKVRPQLMLRLGLAMNLASILLISLCALYYWRPMLAA